MVPEESPIEIAAAGDVFPGDHYFSLGHGLMSRTENGTLESLFSEVSHFLRRADLALCNLEGPLSRKSDQNSLVQSSAFRGIPEYCRLLKDAGFTHINIANNHILQHGVIAFEATIDALRDHEMRAVGLSGRTEGLISSPVVSTVRNRSVCVVGYSAVRERYKPEDVLYAHFEDPEAVVAEIAHLARQFDDVVVSCHAGDEGLPYPSPGQASMYRQFIDAGARCILGHHSHVFQPVERHGHGVIAYSLGNFVFDLFWDERMTKSAILLLKLGASRIDWEIAPTRFASDYSVRLADAQQAARFSVELASSADRMLELDEDQYRHALIHREAGDQRAKYMYFARHLGKGHTARKLRFLAEKFLPGL